MKYKTKHKTELIEFLKKHQDEHLTINEIQRSLKKIPQATLYRLMDSLVESGQVRKYFIEPNSSCCFQYVGDEHCHEHFHLICKKCGKLIHLECDEVNHLLQHIKDDHGFEIDVSKVNFYGECDECAKEGK